MRTTRTAPPCARTVTLRTGVTGARGDRIPRLPEPVADDAEGGRGLRIVDAYADYWGLTRAPAGAKTLWAELGGRDPGAAGEGRDRGLS
ncbi:hypothetical protein A4E84_17280 [Streptomyces qaidamensis]|uniref:Histidine kinase/HSP90-like ATPase domain-containing protein n=1 Tax=Streptomyces qaidamensis TaxID=1783515 RepID=A0A143C162_9ACTN|nr:ATP-binding protein [Streptomyces qaidamensis]AMW11101.1 hypothetical protein A4E84_17280 [Streptomyces qaidamensis]